MLKVDAVYMPSEKERYEYVLNEVGRIYTGSHESKSSRDWYFEQVRFMFEVLKLFFL